MIVEELIGRLSLQTKGIDKAKQATKAIQEFRKALQGLAGAGRMKLDGPARMARGLKDAQRAAERAAAAQKKLAGSAGFGRADAAAKQHISTLQRLSTAYKDAAKSQALLGRGPRVSGQSWLHGELNALRRYRAEMRAVTKEAGRLGVPRHRAERMARVPYDGRHPVGEALVGKEVGGAVMRGSQYAVAQGANVQQETNRQRNAGMEAAQIARLDKTAIGLSAEYPSVDATKIREMGRDARNMFPNFDMAMEALPEIVKAQVMLQASKGKDAAENEMGDFLKGADILGKTENVGDFKDLLNSYVKAVQVEGRQLPLNEYKQFAKYSKAGGVNLSNEFMGGVAPTFMQSEGGARFGTQIASGIKSLISGRRTKKSTLALQDLGLLDKKGKLKNADKYQTNPYQYAVEDMMPALQRKKVNINDDKAVQAYMSRIFSDAMTENLFTKMITQRDQVERNLKTYRGANGSDAAKSQLRGDPYVGLEGLVAQIRNFLGITQNANVDAATKKLGDFTEAFGGVNKKLADSPGSAQALGVGTGIAAGGLAALSVKLIGGAVRRILGLGGKVGAGAGSAATGAAAAEGAVGAGAATGAGSAATGAAALASAPVIGTAIGTAAGAAFAAYATGQQLPKIAATEGPGAIDPATGEKLDTEIPNTTPWLRNRIAALFGGQSEDPEAKATLAREVARGREMQRRDALTPYGQKHADTEKARLADPQKPASSSRLADTVQKHADTEKARLAEVQSAAQKVIDTLNTQTTIKVDSSQIDAAQAKADKLKATIAGIGSVSGSLGGSALAKGSNAFTSPGATAP